MKITLKSLTDILSFLIKLNRPFESNTRRRLGVLKHLNVLVYWKHVWQWSIVADTQSKVKGAEPILHELDEIHCNLYF
jgi:hypothetical protein